MSSLDLMPKASHKLYQGARHKIIDPSSACRSSCLVKLLSAFWDNLSPKRYFLYVFHSKKLKYNTKVQKYTFFIFQFCFYLKREKPIAGWPISKADISCNKKICNFSGLKEK